MKNRGRKFRGYSPVRAVGGEAEKTKVGVEKGYGPRHVANALEGEEVDPQKASMIARFQGGAEAVPGELPSPPADGENYAGRALRWVAGQVREGILPDEAIEEIKRNPASLRSIMAYVGAAMALSGGKGGEGKLPKVVPEGWEGHPEVLRQIKTEGEKLGWDAVRIKKPSVPEESPEGLKGGTKDLTAVNTDSVPAMLTPREAVLNRNAAEMAGRGEIEALNAKGNMLAKRGVDLAARGETSVRKEVMKSKPKQSSSEVPAYGKLPVPPQAQPAKGGGFYPPGMSKFAEGDTSVPEGIGRPNPQRAYDPNAQVDFKAPDMMGFIKALHEEGKKQGLSESQMAGIAKQFGGMGGGGVPSGGDLPYDQLGGQYASFSGGSPGYQGGISEIGYPPMLMPNAEYHGDKGSTWTGRYDPQFLVERYAGGTGDVPGLRRGDGDFRGGGGGGFGASTMAWGGDRPSWNPNAFPPDLPPIGGSNTPNLDRPFQGNNGGYINRSSWQGGAPGMPWSPTAIPTTYDPQGYPFAVPVQGPDQNLQGVGRTHNLRKNQ